MFRRNRSTEWSRSSSYISIDSASDRSLPNFTGWRDGTVQLGDFLEVRLVGSFVAMG